MALGSEPPGDSGMELAKGREARPCASTGSPRRPTTPSSVPIASTHLLRGYGAALGLGGPSLRSSPDEEGPSSLPQGKPFCDRFKRRGRVDPVQSQRKKSRSESSTPPTHQAPLGLGPMRLVKETPRGSRPEDGNPQPGEKLEHGRPRPAVVAAGSARRSLGAPFGGSGGPRPTTVAKSSTRLHGSEAIFDLTKHNPD